MVSVGFGCSVLLAVLACVIISLYRAVVLAPITFTPVDLTGKKAIVTGATSGIGYESALKLAAWNATVFLPVRSLQKGERIRAKILSLLPEESIGSVELMECDLSSFQSVRKFVKTFNSQNENLHILLLNAGVQPDPTLASISADAIENAYQVNHLSHFLLTRLLNVTLLHSAPSRVVHVSSSVHYLGEVDREAYSNESRNLHFKTRRFTTYFDTKLMNVLFSNKLHKMLGSKGLTSIAVHPGFVISSLDQNMPGILPRIMLWIREKIARATADGAITQITAATLPELQSAGGQYLEDRCISNLCTSCVFCKPGGGVGPASAANAEAEQDWLWATSSAIVGMHP